MATRGELDSTENAREYSRAFLVGWRLAQLYASPSHTDQITPVVDEEGYLPGISIKLTQQQQAQLIWVGLHSDLPELPGGKSADISAAITSLDVALKSPAFKEEAISDNILNVFKITLANVYVVNPHLAKSLILGQQLAGLVFGRVGAPSGFTSLQEQLSADRVRRTCSLLDELQSAFPLRATAAVSGSLVCWRHWMETRSGADNAVRENLRSQGERWRGLLTGEIHGDDLLDLQDYRQAMGNYIGEVAGLYRKNPWLLGTVLAMLAATGTGIWAIVTYAPKGAAVVAAIIATVAGALGITWKTVAVTAGKAAALIERPMFDKEISEAVKIAAFIPPVHMTSAQVAKLRKEVQQKDEQPVKEEPLGSEVQKSAIEASADASVPAAGEIQAPDVMAS